MRLVVPERLRGAVGRREFVQSTRTHELAIAKLVATVLLVDWRKQLHRLVCTTMSIDLLTLVEGAPALTFGGYLPISTATTLSGISEADLLRAAADGRLSLYCQVGQVTGYLVPGLLARFF